jgi:hypothetical protein
MREEASSTPHNAPIATFGPELPDWGSWQWVGADLVAGLASTFRTRTFSSWEQPEGDVVVVVKHPPNNDWIDRVARCARIIYAPIDAYDSSAAIDADAPWLRKCARVVIHSERLRKYFSPYVPVDYLDHHVKFAAPLRESFQSDGNLLWVGVRTNLAPLVAWVRSHALPRPLDVVTNLEDPERAVGAAELGFPTHADIRIHQWSPEVQFALTETALAAIDIKGTDFRSRHKPPAKAIDFIASGLPLAMNEQSSPVEHLARMGFEVASPLDPERWLSREYWEETRRFGLAMRELLSLDRIARRWKLLIDEVLAVHGQRGSSIRRAPAHPP